MKRPLALGGVLAALSIAASVALLVSGCAAVQQALNIENPRYSFREIRPRVNIALPLSASAIDIDFNIAVENPNRVGIRLDQLDFNLLINNSRVLDGVTQQNIRIPANGTGDVRLTTRIGYNNIRTIWNEMIDVIRGERANYEIQGTAYYDTPVGRLQFPVTVYSSR